jgi:GAF domain-containing protein
MDPSSFDRRLAEAALEMAQRPSTTTTVERAIALATEVIPACDAAAMALFEQVRTITVAASDEGLRDLVEHQFGLGAGPTLAAYESRETVYSADLAADPRWPEYGGVLSRQAGLCTAYAVPLTVRDRTLAVMTLYSKRVDGFDEEDRAAAEVVASHAAVAVADAVSHDQLETALASRTLIGQATGIVMERWGLDASTAFGVLRRLSQSENLKVREIAARIVETGRVHS